MNKINKIRQLAESIKVPNQEVIGEDFQIINIPPKELLSIPDPVSIYCHIPQLRDMQAFKRCFSYLITGAPNTGKSTWIMYQLLLLAMNEGMKFCIWSQEMEDSYFHQKKIRYHHKDMVKLLAWTLIGKTTFEAYAKKHDVPLASKEELLLACEFVDQHFKFIHCHDRTPAGIMLAFESAYDKYGIDGFVIDPWKSVKQDHKGKRSDIYLEDALMSFKEFTFETNSILFYIVHPKSLNDFKGDDGEYRVVRSYDLNGGAAWFNSMDVILSLRGLMNGSPNIERTEIYTLKARKQHLIGRRGDYKDIYFNMDSYRFLFGENRYCPIEKKGTVSPYASNAFPTKKN